MTATNEPIAKKQKCSNDDNTTTTNNNNNEQHPHHAGGAEALRLKAGKDSKKYEGDIIRKQTEVEKQVLDHEIVAESIVDALPKEDGSTTGNKKGGDNNDNMSLASHHKVDLFLPEILKDCLFVGHLVTDLDSVAGAIGAAELYGGTAALASEVNSETQFALDKWNVKKPETIENLLKDQPDAQVCLVDHQQTSQMNPSINVDNIVGVIDHHALQSKTIVTDKPIYIDIRPWGSMSTIIGHTFLTHGRRPPVHVAGMLLCAILSDTLNLCGPTTTEWDRLMVAVLADIAGVDDIQLLASQQFKAKSSELANMSPFNLVNGDCKSFSYENTKFGGEVGFAVVETTDDGIIMARINELIPEMIATKKEKNFKAFFLAIVNIVDLKSYLLLCGPTESILATDTFGGSFLHENFVMDLGNRVSRKKDFIPAITKIIKGGWTKPETVPRGYSLTDLDQLGQLEVDPNDPFGNVQRKGMSETLATMASKVSPTASESNEKQQQEKDFGIGDEIAEEKKEEDIGLSIMG